MFNLKTVRDLARMKDIILVLLKYGFDELVDRLNVPGDFLVRRITKIQEDLSEPERVRMMLEELGTTFIKFGQMASMRPDLVSERFVLELVKLQDKVPPVEFSAIREQVESELGRDVNQLFLVFEEEPLASASIAQIHRAVLKDPYKEVVVKVQRPGIEKIVRADLEIMVMLARRIHERAPEYQTLNLPGLVADFKNGLLQELDFRREARNIMVFKQNFSDVPNVFAPGFSEDLSTKRVLTLDYIRGEKVYEFQGSEEQRRELARMVVDIAVKQVLEDGFFHGDPHSGNVLVVDGEKLCMMDWGRVGRVSRSTRNLLMELIEAVADHDEEALVETGLKIVEGDFIGNVNVLETGVLESLDSFYLNPGHQQSIGRFLLDLVEIFRKQQMRMPANMARMAIALLEAEGVARKLDPHLEIVEKIRPRIKKVMAERYEPKRLGKEVVKQSRNFVFDLARLPGRLSRLAERIGTEHFSLSLEHRGLSKFAKTLENASNRLAFAIVTGSLIIGSSMILVAEIRPLVYGYSFIGMLGYLFSAILGGWLVVDIIRKRKL